MKSSASALLSSIVGSAIASYIQRTGIIFIGLLFFSTTNVLYAEDKKVEQKNGHALWQAIQPLPVGSNGSAQKKNQQHIKSQLQTIQKQIDRFTSMPLTNQSTLYLRHDGFKIETLHQRGIITKFRAKEKGDVTFTVKFSF
jgi:hypothetical protein